MEGEDSNTFSCPLRGSGSVPGGKVLAPQAALPHCPPPRTPAAAPTVRGTTPLWRLPGPHKLFVTIVYRNQCSLSVLDPPPSKWHRRPPRISVLEVLYSLVSASCNVSTHFTFIHSDTHLLPLSRGRSNFVGNSVVTESLWCRAE